MLRLLLPITAALLLLACIQTPQGESYQTSSSLPGFEQSSFDAYREETRRWLRDNRAFVSGDTLAEIEANTPFEVIPHEGARRGILLVHGLSDSPTYFEDIAQSLANRGFLVRTLLLPGHGSRPADLQLASLQSWNRAVAHHTKLLGEQVDELWLGGFSTGANLVTTEAIDNPRIDGLLLFSPGFEPRFKTTALSPYLDWLVTWANLDPETNYYRYESLTMHGAALYYQSSVQVRDALVRKGVDRPALVTISAADSVIAPQGVLSLFQEHFTHPGSQLVWYGELETPPSRTTTLPGRLPKQRIASIAHMSVLFRPDNKYYGRQGRYRICDNGQSEQLEAACPQNPQPWYGAWGTKEPDQMVARLSWNPYYRELEAQLDSMIASADGRGRTARLK
ncbi:alpha/beta hydrolase [Ferrimonas futtsuensis]|uniref:alpha/beta hydrolase n=1 Tax=Ferrimonas futtsuensis TaxID=364764 RepID=UPI00040DED2D|nr:alpha/beta fold hydrolase [Ferrimonas futtsuensis]